jgi:predicted Abi (CAAX) family protease
MWAIGKMRPINSTSWPTLKTNEKGKMKPEKLNGFDKCGPLAK